MLNGVPVAVGHGFDSPAVQCESQAPPVLLKKIDLHIPRSMGMSIGELGGDQVAGAVKCAGQHPIRACDEARGLPPSCRC